MDSIQLAKHLFTIILTMKACPQNVYRNQTRKKSKQQSKKYSIWLFQRYLLKGDIKWIALMWLPHINPYGQIMENSSRNFSKFEFWGATQAVLLENSSIFFKIWILGRHGLENSVIKNHEFFSKIGEILFHFKFYNLLVLSFRNGGFFMPSQNF